MTRDRLGAARWYVRRLPGRAKVLASLVGFVGGLNLVARAYLYGSDQGMAYVCFWSGLAVCFVSAIAVGGDQKSSVLQRILGLFLMSSALYLPVFLRSPNSPTFQDELFHIQTLELMRDEGTSQVPITFYPIAGNFPGLEYVGLATLYATGLSVACAARLIALSLHVMMPILAFYTYRTVGLRSFGAFYASLFWIANVGFFYFFSTFSYGTLGIVLFLCIAMLGHRKNSDRTGGSVAVSGLLILSLFAVVVVHHISSAMAIIYLCVLSVVSAVICRRATLGNVAIYAIVLWFSWLAYQGTRSVSYLYGNFVPRVRSILEFVVEEQSQTHQLFLNSTLPLGERIIAYGYPVALFILCGLSIRAVFYKRSYPIDRREYRAGYLALAILGPLSWFAIGPLILSDSAEIVYRISPYLFVGVGFYAALCLVEWAERNGVWRRLVLLSVTGTVLAGGIIIGDNQAGRFGSDEIHTAGGPEVLTANLVHAAEWMESEKGRFNLTVGDLMSSIAFAVFGMQRTALYGNWEPFYAADLASAQEFLDRNQVGFLVVDVRDGKYPPRYRYYFSQGELYDERLQPSYLDNIFPAELLLKFDTMPRLGRIYDNGDIVIYEVGFQGEGLGEGSRVSSIP
jgi:hypothetical protein